MKGYKQFLKKGVVQQRATTINSSLLDSAILLQKSGFTIVKAEPYVGATAFCIKIAEEFAKTQLVVYVDVNKGLTDTRVEYINQENFILVQPLSFVQVLELGELLKDQEVLYILDHGSLLPDGSLDSAGIALRSLNPLNTILATERINRYSSELWGEVVYLTLDKNFYSQRELIGHFIKIKGSVGETTHFISHTTGRFSPAYEKAAIELAQGKLKGDIFEYQELSVRGFWKFLTTAVEQGY